MEITPATQEAMRDFSIVEPRKDEGRDRRYLIAAFGSLCVIMLMVALDATSLAVALPVSFATPNHCYLAKIYCNFS